MARSTCSLVGTKLIIIALYASFTKQKIKAPICAINNLCYQEYFIPTRNRQNIAHNLYIPEFFLFQVDFIFLSTYLNSFRVSNNKRN